MSCRGAFDDRASPGEVRQSPSFTARCNDLNAPIRSRRRSRMIRRRHSAPPDARSWIICSRSFLAAPRSPQSKSARWSGKILNPDSAFEPIGDTRSHGTCRRFTQEPWSSHPQGIKRLAPWFDMPLACHTRPHGSGVSSRGPEPCGGAPCTPSAWCLRLRVPVASATVVRCATDRAAEQGAMRDTSVTPIAAMTRNCVSTMHITVS